MYIENNLFKYQQISERFSDMETGIRSTESVNSSIIGQLETRIQSYEEQGRAVSQGINHFLAEKYNHANLEALH